jgi:hypothetical protein
MNNSKIKFKIFIIFLSVLFTGCTGDLEKAKDRGFSSIEEMNQMTAKGFNTKNEYVNKILKNTGCDTEEELNHAMSEVGGNCKVLADIRKKQQAEEAKSNEIQQQIIKNKKWFMYNSVFAQPDVLGKCEETFSLGEHINTLDALGKKYKIESIQQQIGIPVVVDFTSDLAPSGAVFERLVKVRFYKGEELCLEDAQKIVANAKNLTNSKQRESSKYN